MDNKTKGAGTCPKSWRDSVKEPKFKHKISWVPIPMPMNSSGSRSLSELVYKLLKLGVTKLRCLKKAGAFQNLNLRRYSSVSSSRFWNIMRKYLTVAKGKKKLFFFCTSGMAITQDSRRKQSHK